MAHQLKTLAGLAFHCIVIEWLANYFDHTVQHRWAQLVHLGIRLRSLVVRIKNENETKLKGANYNDSMTKEQVYEQFISLLATDSETIMQALGWRRGYFRLEC